MPESSDDAATSDPKTPPAAEGDQAQQLARFLQIADEHPELVCPRVVDDLAAEYHRKYDDLCAMYKPGGVKHHEGEGEHKQEIPFNALLDLWREIYAKLPKPTSFEGNPSGMREHIESLIEIGPGVGLRAVFEMTRKEYESEGGLSRGDKAGVWERTHNLMRMLYEMSQGPASAVALARLRTLLRYMLEPNYTQNIAAAKLLQQWVRAGACEEGSTPRIKLKHGDWAFDLGCGPGAALDILEKMVGNREWVRGYDINPLNALRDEKGRIRVGVIDAPQERMTVAQGGVHERLSFQTHFNKGGLVLASLVLDRVANQAALFMNCKKLLRPGGTLVMPLLLPVTCEDDEPDLACRLQYAVDPLTAGEDPEQDFQIIAAHLQEIGFCDVSLHHVPIDDPVTKRRYDNHYIILAQKNQQEVATVQNKRSERNQGDDQGPHGEGKVCWV